VDRRLRSCALLLAAVYCAASAAPCPRSTTGAALHAVDGMRVAKGEPAPPDAPRLVALCPCHCEGAEPESGSAGTGLALRTAQPGHEPSAAPLAIPASSQALPLPPLLPIDPIPI
jgi:hypothetical protein